MLKNIIKKEFKLFVERLFFCFSLLVLAMAVVGLFMQTDANLSYMTVNQIMSFFLFAVLFAVSFTAADFVKNTILRRCVQFVLTMLSVAAVFIPDSPYIASSQNPSFSVLIVLFLGAIVYCVVAIIYLIFSAVASKIFKGDEEYKEVYAKSKKG